MKRAQPTPSFKRVILWVTIGAVGLILAAVIPDFIKQERERHTQLRARLEGLIDIILTTNTSEPVMEAFGIIKNHPGEAIALEYSVVAEALLHFRFNQEGFNLATLGINHARSTEDRLLFLKIKARAAYQLGQLETGRATYETAIQLIDAAATASDRQAMLEAEKLVLLSKWLQEELGKGQCKRATRILETIKEMDDSILLGLPRFIRQDANSIQAVCA